MQNNSRIHVTYIIAILIAVIICLVTIQWGNIPRLVELISFALTISSLVLAVLAIVYAVYSNNSFGHNIAKLDSASNYISDSTKSLSTITEDLKRKFDRMPDLLETISKKTDTTQLLLSQLSEKSLGTVETKFIKSNAIETESIKNILTKTSINGQLILYILKLGKDSKREFETKDLAEKCDISKDYILGFLSPLNALGLLKLKETGRKGQWYWQVTDLHDDIYNNINDAITKLWNENREKDHMHFILDNINKVRLYFDLPPMPKDKNFS
ncbi:MAG: hypothetical protein IPP27_02100 [Bacteroidetes bacterium]|nr:hypothetical protein [Bacteroidota bacterium]MBK9414453.1 hypothetical protein [Bacteroidota bacterium]MBL0031009.1 hypothetical protein [Bacteroidota bacterium]MBP6585804.1 hypothetical protein [Flavobacterium sp.]